MTKSRAFRVGQSFSKLGVLSKASQAEPEAIGGASTASHDSALTLPASAAIGEQAFVSATNTLYMWNGSGWYKIAIVNNAPFWDSTGEPAGSFVLALDGTPTSVTVLAQDSEGLPLTYTYQTGGAMTTMASISQGGDGNRTFTITPDSLGAVGPGLSTGTMTFRASDGINVLSKQSTFTINFVFPHKSSRARAHLYVANYQAGKDNQTNWDRDIKDSGSSPWTPSQTRIGDADTNSTSNVIEKNRPREGIMRIGTSPYQPRGFSWSFSTYYLGRIMVRNKDTSSLVLPQSGNWTLEGWCLIYSYGQASNVYNSVNVNDHGIVTTENYDNTGGGMALVVNVANKKVNLRVSTGSTESVLITGVNEICRRNPSGYTWGATESPWFHWAIVNNGGTIKLYTNGRLEGSASQPYDFNTTSGDLMFGCTKYAANLQPQIGQSSSYDMEILPGYLTDMRLVKSAVYTSEFSPPSQFLDTIADTTLHISAKRAPLLDVSTIEHTVEYFSGYVSNSNTMAGTNHPFAGNSQNYSPYDHLTYDPAVHGGSYFRRAAGHEGAMRFISSAPAMTFTGDFSVSFWYKMENHSYLGDDSGVIAMGDGTGTNDFDQLSLLWYETSNVFYYRTRVGGNGVNRTSFGPAILNQWAYVCIQRSGSTVTFHINGKLLSSETNSNSLNCNYLGWGYHGGTTQSNYNNGRFYMCDLYILNGSTLPSTYPPAELRETGAAVHHLKGDDQAYYNAAHELHWSDHPDYYMSYNATNAGNIKVLNDSPTGFSKYQSIDFPGSGSGSSGNFNGGLRTDPPQRNYNGDSWSGNSVRKGAVTVSFWFKAGDVSGTQYLYYAGEAGSDFFDAGLGIYLSGSTLYLNVKTEDTVTSGQITKTGISAGTWYHVAATVGNLGGVTFHVDGVLQGRFTIDNRALDGSDFPKRSNPYVFIACDGNSSPSNFYNGQLADINSTGKAQYPQDMNPTTLTKTNSTSHETVTASNVKLLAANGASVTTEGTGNGTHTITAIGSPTLSNFGPAGAPGSWKSIYFDGTNDGLSVSASADWQFASGDDFCIEFWWWCEAWQGSGNTSFFNVGNSYGSGDFQLYRRGADSQIKVWNGSSNILNTPTGAADLIDSYWPAINNWNHLALTRKSGKVILWYNGSPSQVGDITSNTDTLNGGTGNVLYIGQAINGQERFKGYISQFRWVKGDCVYEENFTVPGESIYF